MTASAGFIDFFVLEASEYVEQLDALMLRATAAGPDGDAMQRTARALRGAATMAKLSAFAELAAALEGIGRATRDGVIAWDATLRGAVIAAVDDLKFLVRGARAWGDAEIQRASTRTRELVAFAPATRRANATAAAVGGAFLVGEANNIAAGLELLTTRPDDRVGAANVLGRVRALRGVAGVKDVPRLAEIAEATENAARTLELGEPRLSLERVELLRGAAALFRRVATALRDGAPTDAPSDEYNRFIAAVEALDSSAGNANHIVPITSLFFDDAGPHVMSIAPNPPTTPAQRFRLELVSLGEHFNRLVNDARAATETAARDRIRRDLRRALHTIKAAAESFNEMEVANQVTASTDVITALDGPALNALEGIATALASPGAHGEQFAAALAALGRHPTLEEGIGDAFSPLTKTPPAERTVTGAFAAIAGIPRPAPAGIPTPPLSIQASTSTLASAATSLDDGIARLDAFTAQPFVRPAVVEEQIVPIDALLYRGHAAVRRAIEVRDQIRHTGTSPAPEALEELFALLDLALVE